MSHSQASVTGALYAPRLRLLVTGVTFELGKGGMLDGAISFFRSFRYRYDFFISYKRTEAWDYGAALQQRLGKSGLRCFLDRDETPPGTAHLQRRLVKAVHRSAALVLVGTPGVRQSASVLSEIKTALAAGRTLIAVDVEHALTQPELWDVLKDLDLARAEETAEAVRTGHPTATVLDAIHASCRFWRRATRERVATIGTGLVILVLLGAASYFLASRIRVQAQRLADQTTALERERTLTKIAEDRRLEAEHRRQEAESASRQAHAEALASRALNLISRYDDERGFEYRPDRFRLAVLIAAESARTWPSELSAQLLDRADRLLLSQRLQIAGPRGISRVALDMTARRLVLGTWSGEIRVYDLEARGRLLWKHRLPREGVTSVAFDREGRRVAWTYSHHVGMVDLSVHPPKVSRDALDAPAVGVVFDQVHDRLILGTATVANHYPPKGTRLLVRDNERPGLLATTTTLYESDDRLERLVASERGEWIVGVTDKTLIPIRNAGGIEVGTPVTRNALMMGVAVGSDGVAASRLVGGMLELTSVSGPKRVFGPVPLRGHPGPFAVHGFDVAYASSAAQEDQVVRILGIPSHAEIHRCIVPELVTAVLFAPDGTAFVTVGSEGTIRIWNYDRNVPYPRKPITAEDALAKVPRWGLRPLTESERRRWIGLADRPPAQAGGGAPGGNAGGSPR
jgi:hypothetical protein